MNNIKLPIVLKRPRAFNHIVIDVDDEMNMDDDDWFISVKYIKTKTGVMASQSCIVRKDLNGWLTSLKRQKYVIDNEEIKN